MYKVYLCQYDGPSITILTGDKATCQAFLQAYNAGKRFKDRAEMCRVN